MPPVSARQELKPAQQRALAFLRKAQVSELTRGRYQAIGHVSRSQAAYDLAELVDAGVLERVGAGRSTRYVLVREPNGTRRHWTSGRIRAELASFCVGRRAWPSAHEFKSAGHGDLYVAVSRYGGVAFWAAELGLERGGRPWEATSIARLKPALSWATAGAVGGALAVAAAVAIAYGLPRGGATPEARSATSTGASIATGRSSRWRPPRLAKATPAKVKVVKPDARKPRLKTTHASTPASAQLAVQTISSSSTPAPHTTPTSEPVRTAVASTSTATGGPSPLTAPSGGSGTPSPLLAPRR